MERRSGALRRLAGYGVHIFTALGSVCALLATLAIIAGRFEVGFAWLFVALFIDAVDGTIARAVSVETALPRFSGERLDLIVDYVTYVFVPVIALLTGGYLTGTSGFLTAALILLSSLHHFADKRSKANDNCFVGFPAVWNLVAFCIFAWGLPWSLATALCLLLAGLTFVPMHWIHPMRVQRWFALNVLAALGGVAGGVAILVRGFPGELLPVSVVTLSAAYFVGMALIWRRPEQGA